MTDTEKCESKMKIPDDFGDNYVTMKCQLEHGHEGLHREEYQNAIYGQIMVTWEGEK